MTDDSIENQDLMKINVGDSRIRKRGKLLLIGSCMDRFPEIVNEFAQKNDGYMTVNVCMEEIHVNQAGFKIASIVRYSDLSEVTVLTIDGSPHCVQLHYVVEDIRRHFTPELETKHYVIEKGEVHEISPDAVKKSRHLSKIQKMLD